MWSASQCSAVTRVGLLERPYKMVQVASVTYLLYSSKFQLTESFLLKIHTLFVDWKKFRTILLTCWIFLAPWKIAILIIIKNRPCVWRAHNWPRLGGPRKGYNFLDSLYNNAFDKLLITFLLEYELCLRTKKKVFCRYLNPWPLVLLSETCTTLDYNHCDRV